MRNKITKRHRITRKPRFAIAELIKLRKKLFMNQGYVGFILLIMVVLAVVLAGGAASTVNQNSKQLPIFGTLVNTSPAPGSKETLQLKTLTIITSTPTIQTALCQNQQINDESEILAYPAATGQSITVAVGGQIKVWVTDEASPKISQGEVVDQNTGLITQGQRSAKAPDNYLWEPAIYIAPNLAETGGTPHFPDIIKGDYNNNPLIDIRNGVSPHGPTIDPIPSGGSQKLAYTSEYIWNVSSLALTPGSYSAEFVIHDGDVNRGIGCVGITVQ